MKNLSNLNLTYDKRIDKIILKITNKYYPRAREDWSERHRALGCIGMIIKEIDILIHKIKEVK